MASLSDRIIIKLFNAARKFYTTFFGKYILPQPIPNRDPTFANKTIYELLSSDKPCMIGRFGSNEIECTVFTRNRKFYKYNLINYVRGKSDIWWYPESTINRMYYNAGFFSPSIEQLDKFGEEMMSAMPLLDVLGSWCKEEGYFLDKLSKATFIDLELLNPAWGCDSEPWTLALEGKKVLVVHPFTDTIQAQYAQRSHVHKDPRLLPEFTLITLKAVQSITGQKPDNFETWFDALQHMQNEIDKIDYDICIIGCGAYGGKRWEDPNYGFNGKNYLSFMTPYWVRPSETETPQKSSDIEDGCYW